MNIFNGNIKLDKKEVKRSTVLGGWKKLEKI